MTHGECQLIYVVHYKYIPNPLNPRLAKGGGFGGIVRSNEGELRHSLARRGGFSSSFADAVKK